MEPPEATSSTQQGAGATPPAVSVCLVTITERADFIAASRAKRWGVKGFMIQARNRMDDTDTIRIGYTCSKKVGNAVARNRAKRRLREIARLGLGTRARPGWDYVLIGKRDVTATREFTDLQGDLKYALKKVHE